MNEPYSKAPSARSRSHRGVERGKPLEAEHRGRARSMPSASENEPEPRTRRSIYHLLAIARPAE